MMASELQRIHSRARNQRMWQLCLVTIVALMAILPSRLVAAKDDILQPIVMAEPAYESQPQDLLSENDVTNINKTINEARGFGLPFAVRIQSVPSPQTPEATLDAAKSLFTTTPIESADGADDGLLLFVQVPSNDKTLSTATFVSGANFFPQGGITQARLDAILNDIILPGFTTDTIGNSVLTGVQSVVYDQIFITSPRIERSNGQTWLARITHLAIAPLLILIGVGFALYARNVRDRSRDHITAGERIRITSPFAAAAIARGRVDDAISAAALARLIDLGSINLVRNRSGQTRIHLGPDPVSSDPFLERTWHHISDLANTGSGIVDDHSLRTLRDTSARERSWLESYLATCGYFYPRARVQNRSLIVIGSVIVIVTLYAITPAMVSLSRFGLAVAGLLIAEVAIILWWSLRRSFATTAGLDALGAWKTEIANRITAGDADARDSEEIYNFAINQDAYLANSRVLDARFSKGTSSILDIVRGYGTT